MCVGIYRADAVYDNQSLSYIHPKRRKSYIYSMENVVNRKAKIVLVTERFNVEDRDEKQQLKAHFQLMVRQKCLVYIGK